MTWLVTGGAGYIGSHVVRAFQAAGVEAVVLDDLSSGHRRFVSEGTPLVVGSVLDTDLVTRTLREHRVEGVVHLAGFKYAGVSVSLTYPISSSEQFPRIARLITQAAPALSGACVIAFSHFADVPSEDK